MPISNRRIDPIDTRMGGRLKTIRTLPVITTPFAALLAGHGLARWVASLAAQLEPTEPPLIHVAFRGQSVTVSTSVDLNMSQITTAHYQQPLIDWILTSKNGPAPKHVGVIDYDAERQRNQAYYDTLAALRKAGQSPQRLPQEAQEQLQAQAPRPFWPAAAALNQMSALNAYNKAIERWMHCAPCYPELVGIIWMMTSGEPNALDQAMAEWGILAKRYGLEKNPLLAATQIVNPEQGKGANRAKADKLTIGGIESFWLLEYFKFVGLFHGALPRVVQGRKDRKTYVIVPSREGIEQTWHTAIFRSFQHDFWASSSIKMDIVAALRYTMILIQNWEAALRSSGRRRRVSDYIAGFMVASYKDLGSAVAIMNVANIALPDWVTFPEDADTAHQLSTILTEHQRLIMALDETKSEEEQLLRDYREFMSSRDPLLRAFFSFSAGYARYVIQKMSKRQSVRRLSVDQLQVIIMANDLNRTKPLKPIIENAGFQNIATAIRQATVLQQYHKVKHSDNTYDIRYGLADELLRHARQNRDFLHALSEFLIDYSKENARIMERAKGRPYRKRISITTDDIAQITDLVDQYDAQTIASMLIAFGYARDAYTPDTESAQSDDAEQAEATADTTDTDADLPF